MALPPYFEYIPILNMQQPNRRTSVNENTYLISIKILLLCVSYTKYVHKLTKIIYMAICLASLKIATNR